MVFMFIPITFSLGEEKCATEFVLFVKFLTVTFSVQSNENLIVFIPQREKFQPLRLKKPFLHFDAMDNDDLGLERL